MATFRKRGKGWEYRIRYVDPITGKKSEKSEGGFSTRADAEYAASEKLIDVRDGVIIKRSNISFNDFADLWFENYKTTIKETSLRSRKGNLNTLKKALGNLKLKSLTYNLYQKKINELSKIYKRNTLVSINQIGQMIARKAVKDGYFKSNPIADTKIPHYDNEQERIEYWEPVSIQIFQNFLIEDINKKRKKGNEYLNLERERELALFYLLLYGGLRIGEACALSINDYYPLTKEIDISKTLGSPLSNQTKNSYKIYPPKTKSAYRTVPLPEIAYKQLEIWIAKRKEYTALFPLVYHESQYLFCKKDGSPLTPRDVRSKFNVIVQKLNLPKITLHGLRHTYTALQIQAGIDPKSLQLLLGHANVKTTLDIYSHITKDKQKTNIDKFNQMLNNLNGGAKVGQEQKSQKQKE
ncbi:tyrosine-type recombinase/integrase [Enterococcus sp. AZ103]|uniref:tyrosine-type recombinase/integrase n=1 Tax=Enterococcus sp. AZ103 TaxID=2774628 RepID=UPI003F294AA9